MRDDVIKTMKFLFIWMLIASVYLINCRWQKFQGFCGSNHTIYKTISTWMFTAYWQLQNRGFSHLCLNVNCFCLFDKLLLKRNLKFLWKQPHMSLLYAPICNKAAHFLKHALIVITIASLCNKLTVPFYNFSCHFVITQSCPAL